MRFPVPLVAILCLLVSPLAAQPTARPATRPAAQATSRLLVRMAGSADIGSAVGTLRELRLSLLDSVTIGPLRIYVLLQAPGTDLPRLRDSLRATGLFAYVEPDLELAPADSLPADLQVHVSPPKRPRPALSAYPPDDPLFADQYALENRGAAGGMPGADIDIEEAWKITEGDSGVVIAVSEEGFDGSHPDLGGVFVADSAAFAAANNGFWHGTLVAGILAARKGNGEGIAGIAPGCRLLIVHGDYGTSMLSVLKALEKVVQWDAAVYTNSWGFRQLTLQPLQEAYDVVARSTRGGRGTLVVFASGNNGEPWVSYPGWFDRFIAVGATTRDDRRWELSNYGRELDVVAPGGDILSTAKGGGYSTAWGTSLAAPMVAGTAALIASANPTLGADSIRAIIELTCDKIGGYRYEGAREHGIWSPYTGYGRINAGRALRMARGIRDSAQRIVWPRGGEILAPTDSITVHWRGERPSILAARTARGELIELGRSGSPGDHAATWHPAGEDTLRILLVDSATGTVVDSLRGPLLLRSSRYTVRIDTAAPFVGLDEYARRGAIGPILRDRAVMPLPFDVVIGADTIWAWGADARWLTPYRVVDHRLRPGSQPQLDPRFPSGTGIAALLLNDAIGVDSIRFGVIGAAPEREAIVELDGLQVDSLLYSEARRRELGSYRRQIRFHERTGTISLHFDRPLELRPDAPGSAERAALRIGLKAGSETVLPFGDVYLDRLPAGVVELAPAAYRPPETPLRAAIYSTGARETYGYDILRTSFATNRAEGRAQLRASSDSGLTWFTLAEADDAAGAFAALVPPRFAGTLLLSLAPPLDAGWRDTVVVVDHGYTIEPLGVGIPASIADDPRASRLEFSGDGTVEIPLLDRLSYFGRSVPRLRVFRSGRVEPLPDDGGEARYAMIKVTTPPIGLDPDSLAPVHLLYLDEPGRSATILEWDSLARYEPVPGGWSAARGSRAQLRIWSDGVLEVTCRTPDTGAVPYYFFPSVAYGQFVLIHPELTLRPDFTSPLRLPLGGYRFIPHVPMSGVAMPGVDAPDGSHLSSDARSELRVAPNPTAGRFSIVADGRSGAWSVELLTPLGRSVARLRGTGERIEVPAGMLEPGLYFIRRTDGPSGSRAATAVMILR